MIGASEIKKQTIKRIEEIKETEEYKYAMKKLEAQIEEAARNGRSEFSFNKCALVKDHAESSPSRAVLEALKSECEKHGYSFTEYQRMNMAGYYNSCYRVSW